jgi:hypothetical protein
MTGNLKHPWRCGCGADVVFWPRVHFDGVGGGFFTLPDERTKVDRCPRCSHPLGITQAALSWALAGG